jgi:signal transduction histidine kinase
LRNLLAVQFRLFIDQADKDEKSNELADLSILEESLSEKERAILKTTHTLAKRHPEAQPLVLQMEDFVQEIHQLTAAAEAMKEAAESELDKTVHLAGLGLMVEMVAHELTRATQHALQTVMGTRQRELPADVIPVFRNLEAQLKTLEKRLRTLDPLSVSGRQTKGDFDVLELLSDTLDAHQAQFDRHSIVSKLTVEGEARPKPLVLHAVKGMFIQIFENLIANSVYWLKQERRVSESFSPKIEIVVDRQKSELLFTDNGPGVPPARKELVFEAFYTSKPPGKGKGLGLYIARQLARYHGVEVKLSDRPTVHRERLNTFVVSFRKLVK